MNEVEFVTPGHPGFTANSNGLAVVVSFEVEYSLKDRVAFFGGFRPSTEIRTGFNWTSDPEGRTGGSTVSGGTIESAYLGAFFNVLPVSEEANFQFGPIAGARYFLASERRGRRSGGSGSFGGTGTFEKRTTATGDSGEAIFGGLAVRYLTTDHHTIQFRAFYNRGFTEMQRSDAEFNLSSGYYEGAVISKGSFLAFELGAFFKIFEGAGGL
jgi:hypothetical protein